ncbi:MAG TPA: hypothetical protein PLZ79_02810 [Burkholderiales bacterium]|nr:hypothetical protein [Burkholderiales bacterium]
MRFLCPSLALAATVLATAAQAQGFAAVVSPPRFELAVKPGEIARQVVEISNVGVQSATFRVRTADWTLAPDGGVSFADALTAGSCRPWVAIERKEIVIPGGGRYRYRFEVHPPADAAPGECRFAVMIEGDEQAVRTASGLTVPVSGRIGVIVYATVGEGAPNLEIVGATTADTDGQRAPVLKVRNMGNAHGRLAGFLSGVDAKGQRRDYAPSTLPILPGETRAIALVADALPANGGEVVFPVKIRGTLEWGSGQRIELDQQFPP